MQPTETSAGEATPEASAGRLTGVARRWLRLAAVLLWVGVGLYSLFQPVRPVPYTVGLFGTAICLTLGMRLLDGDGPETGRRPTGKRSESWSAVDRLLAAGCLLAMAVGTYGVVSAAGGITASQPRFAASAILVAALVVGALFTLVWHWFGSVTVGFAVAGVAVGLLTAPPNGSLVETMVYDSHGLYGPLTRGAASWLAPACLVAGLWQASRALDRLRALGPTVTGSTGWLTGRRLGGGLWLLTPPSMGFVALLVAWQSGASYSRVIAVAAIPAALLWIALCVGGRLRGVPFRIDPVGTAVDWQTWGGPLVAVGGPAVLMGVLLVGFAWPVGTALTVGAASLVGGSMVGPRFGLFEVPGADGTRLRGGLETVVEGSVVGVRLFARASVLLAAVGGVTALLATAGVSTELLSAVVGVTGNRSLLVGLVVAVGCIALGVGLPALAGYATAAVVAVPLLRTLLPMAELTAHLLVWYAVVGGWLLAPVVRQRLRKLVATVDTGRKQR